MRIAVLISGAGSNLRAILQAWKAEEFGLAEIAVVVADRRCNGLQVASDYQVTTEVLVPGERRERDEQLIAILKHHRIDAVVLAGFMRILGKELIDAYQDRILNIHPSLLPDFPGLRAPQQALEAGATESGCTVHIVTPEVDAGPMIAQARCEVLHEDTPESLHRRIQTLEHELYPKAIARWIRSHCS